MAPLLMTCFVHSWTKPSAAQAFDLEPVRAKDLSPIGAEVALGLEGCYVGPQYARPGLVLRGPPTNLMRLYQVFAYAHGGEP